MPDALLEISEEDERRFPEQLTQNPTQTEEYQKRNSRCSNSNEIAPIVEIIKPAINKEKSEHYQEVKQRFSNVNESPSFQVSKEKSKDPLDRYRTPNVSKHISQPKEIIEDHKLRKKIMSFAIFIVFALIVMNLIFLNGSNSTNLVDKEKNKTDIQNSEKKTTINEISESSSHITVHIFEIIIFYVFFLSKDGYNRLGYQIYQRLKIEVTVTLKY